MHRKIIGQGFTKTLAAIVIGSVLAGCLGQDATPTSTASPESTGAPALPASTAIPSLAPSATANPAPTDTLLPASTATIAASERLAEWNAKRADELIVALEAFPKTLDISEMGYHGTAYDQAFKMAALAHQEALLRFPGSLQASSWQWGLAYNHAQAAGRNTGVASEYAALLLDGLQTGSATLDQLAQWFQSQEPRLALEHTDLPLPSGYRHSILVQLATAEYSTSGAFLWLLESDNGFEVYPLQSGWDFGFTHADGISYELADLTGDGSLEVLTRHNHTPGSGTFEVNLDVFDIRQTPPRRFELSESQSRSEPTWSPVMDGQKTAGVQLDVALDKFYACEETLRRVYRWKNDSFQLTAFQILPDATMQPHCADVLAETLLAEAEKGRPIDARLLGAVLVEPDQDAGAAEQRDAARFHLALAATLLGDANIARYHMQAIISDPATPDGAWKMAAGQFLASFGQNEDLAAACMKSGQCYPFLSIAQLLAILPAGSSIDPVAYMQGAGLPMLNSGTFDFDQNGLADYWLEDISDSLNGDFSLTVIVQNPDSFEATSFWTDIPIAGTDSAYQWKSLPVLDETLLYEYTAPPVRLQLAFTNQPDGSIQVMEASELIASILSQVENELLSGRAPAQVLPRLLALQESAILATNCPNRLDCQTARLLYLTGLAYELMGNLEKASQSYLALWQTYPTTPEALMVQHKLQTTP